MLSDLKRVGEGAISKDGNRSLIAGEGESLISLCSFGNSSVDESCSAESGNHSNLQITKKRISRVCQLVCFPIQPTLILIAPNDYDNHTQFIIPYQPQKPRNAINQIRVIYALNAVQLLTVRVCVRWWDGGAKRQNAFANDFIFLSYSESLNSFHFLL